MPRRICPQCGSRNTASILWGLPAMDDNLQEKLYNKEVILGGCLTTDNDPTYHCNTCKKDFGAPTAEKEMNIIKVRFSLGGFFGGYHEINLIKTSDGALASYEQVSRKMNIDEWIHFAHELFKCHIADWKKQYVDPNVLDGTQWELEVIFSSGKPLKIYGCNLYPPHWKSFLKTINRLGLTTMG